MPTCHGYSRNHQVSIALPPLLLLSPAWHNLSTRLVKDYHTKLGWHL